MTTMRILHLSDIHATSRAPLHGRLDPTARLRRVPGYAADAGLVPDVVVVTGDLVDRTDADAYPQVARALGELSDELAAPVLTVLGNHDHPAAAARTLPGHETGHYASHRVAGWRIIRLDSSTGRLGERQLDWLSAELSQPGGYGTLIALHHSPVESPLTAMRGRGLADAAALAHALAGSDARLILCGHYHHAQAAVFRGIPVWNGPALSYQQVMDAGPHRVQGVDEGQLSFIALDPTGFSATPYPLTHTLPPLFTLPAGKPTAGWGEASAPCEPVPDRSASGKAASEPRPPVSIDLPALPSILSVRS